MSALKLLSVMRSTGKPLSLLAKQLTKFPQVLKNIRVREKEGWDTNQVIKAAIAEAETTVGQSGRVFVRASGTESLIRIMVEGADEDLIVQAANKVAVVIQQELG